MMTLIPLSASYAAVTTTTVPDKNLVPGVQFNVLGTSVISRVAPSLDYEITENSQTLVDPTTTQQPLGKLTVTASGTNGAAEEVCFNYDDWNVTTDSVPTDVTLTSTSLTSNIKDKTHCYVVGGNDSWSWTLAAKRALMTAGTHTINGKVIVYYK